MTVATIDRTLTTAAKTRVAKWLDLNGHPAKLRASVLRGIDAIARELPAREDHYELCTIALSKSGDLETFIKAESFQAFQCRDCVAISTIVPSWARGWSKVLKDEEAHHILSWLLHYARQYIHRSYVASALMVLWESEHTVLHPFGNRAIFTYYGPVRPFASAGRAFAEAKASAVDEWGAPNNHLKEIVASDSPWLKRNTLDPLLHQAIFHFLRAQKLRSADFSMESVVAFDCAMQSIIRFVRDRFRLPNEPSRAETLQILSLPADLLRRAEYLYFLRNNFGAHAGGWRWWDQAELLEGDALDGFADLVQLSLAAAADVEPNVRSINPEPSQWCVWFFENFEMLWDSVWFEKVDEWDRKLLSPSQPIS